jgi:hypothetical protein
VRISPKRGLSGPADFGEWLAEPAQLSVRGRASDAATSSAAWPRWFRIRAGRHSVRGGPRSALPWPASSRRYLMPAQPARRPYRSSRRREQAIKTRSDIVQAATRLFVEGGFAASGKPRPAIHSGIGGPTTSSPYRGEASSHRGISTSKVWPSEPGSRSSAAGMPTSS